MKTPHKHAELIKAWADGSDIERLHGTEWREHGWCDIWHHDFEYRIKPVVVKDVCYYMMAYTVDPRGMGIFDITGSHKTRHNLKLTFDGTTKQLKGAEVL